MRAFVGFVFLAACSHEPSAAPGGDASTEDADAPEVSGPQPTIEAHEPTPVVVDRWLVAKIGGSTADPVRPKLEDGTFTMPSAGSSGGLIWTAVAPGKNGEIGTASRTGYLYGAAEVTLAKNTYLIGRFDTALSAYANGSVQAADPYASGKIRVPLSTHEGTNVVAVRGFGARGGQVQAQLFTTPDELVFNTADLTSPDLVVGETLEQWIGVPILNASDKDAFDVHARVEDSADFSATEIGIPSIPAGAVTQVAFKLVPKKAWDAPMRKVPAKLHVVSPTLAASYVQTVDVPTVAAGTTHRRTFRSSIDGSAQYFGLVPPKDYDASKTYGLVLALHGASVEGIGHAQAYSAKDFAWIVAPTNRRPYGFDWEEWGRADAIEILDLAQTSLGTALDRVWLTGHSMGGHGTWNVGTLFAGRFAAIGPSAGWLSFETYQGTARLTGAIGRAQASSNTLDYFPNLAHRGVYIIHGDADDNVPVTEARTAVDALKTITSDVVYHEEPGAGHWWDGDKAPGADCVDWPDLFEFFRAHTLDRTELDFNFRTPSPWVSDRYSFVTIRSAKSAWQDVTLASSKSGDTVTLTTTNVRGLVLDGDALLAKGVANIVVDGETHPVASGAIAVGPQDGKHPGVHGPVNEAFRRPFCFVWPDDASPVLRRYAAYLMSQWAVIGNGAACGVPLSKKSSIGDRNVVYVGVPASGITALPSSHSWSDTNVTAAGTSYDGAAMVVVFPEGNHLAAAFSAPKGSETLLYRFMPFSSRSGVPDWYVWTSTGSKTSGFFDATWKPEPPPP